MTFVRGLTTDQMLDAYGMDVDAAETITWTQALGGRSPAWEPDGATLRPVPCVRVGRSGEWAFGIEAHTFEGFYPGLQLPDSVEDLAIVTWTAKPTYELSYKEGGVWVTGFEPGMDWSLSGSDPARFESQMRELQIMPTGDDAESDTYRDPVLQMLAFLTLIAGIRVPEEVAAGPLLTCQRRTDPP